MALLIQSQTSRLEATTISTVNSQHPSASSPFTPPRSKIPVEIVRVSSFVLKVIKPTQRSSSESPSPSTSLKSKATTTTQLIMAEMVHPTPSPSSSISQSHSQPQSLLDIPDEKNQRGRKRRRSSNNSPPPHLTSNGSTTLRGRVRRRSPSFAISESVERVRSLSPGNGKRRSPGRKHAKWDFARVAGETRGRRSQSLSRSRTRGQGGEREETVKPRRRQRTRSRSREHGVESKPGNGQEQVGSAQVQDVGDSAVEFDDDHVDDN